MFRKPMRIEKWIAFDGAFVEVVDGDPSQDSDADSYDDENGGMDHDGEYDDAHGDSHQPDADDGLSIMPLSIVSDGLDVSVGGESVPVEIGMPDPVDTDGASKLLPFWDSDDVSFSYWTDSLSADGTDFFLDISAPAGGSFTFLTYDLGPWAGSGAQTAFIKDNGLDANVDNGDFVAFRTQNANDDGFFRLSFKRPYHHGGSVYLFSDYTAGGSWNPGTAWVQFTDDGGVRIKVTNMTASESPNEIMEYIMRSLVFTSSDAENPPAEVGDFSVSVYYKENASNNVDDLEDYFDKHDDDYVFKDQYFVGKITVSNAVDPGPVDPGPVDPGPVDPGPVDPGPVDPGPVDPGPVDPGPVDPGPVDPGPVDPGPVDPGPVDPGPEDPGPVDPGPEDPGPEEPGPEDPDPVDPTDPWNPTDPDPVDPGTPSEPDVPVTPTPEIPIPPPGKGDAGAELEEGGEKDASLSEGVGDGEIAGDSSGNDGDAQAIGGDDLVYIYRREETSEDTGVDDGRHTDRDADEVEAEMVAIEEKDIESFLEATTIELLRDVETVLHAVRGDRALLENLLAALREEYVSRDLSGLRGLLRDVFESGNQEMEAVNRIIAELNRQLDEFRTISATRRDGMLTESLRELADIAARRSAETGAFAKALETILQALRESRQGNAPLPSEESLYALFNNTIGQSKEAWLAEITVSDPMGKELAAAESAMK